MFGKEVPATSFVDEAGGEISLSATPLPPWLTFDGTTLRGTPVEKGTVELRVTAKTSSKTSQSSEQSVPLTLRIKDGAVSTEEKKTAQETQAKTGPRVAEGLPEAKVAIGQPFKRPILIRFN